MKKIWIPAALMALAACSMTNNAEKGQGDSQDITARPAITQVAENVPSEPSVDSVEVDGFPRYGPSESLLFQRDHGSSPAAAGYGLH